MMFSFITFVGFKYIWDQMASQLLCKGYISLYLNRRYIFMSEKLSIDTCLCKRGGNSEVYYIEMVDS